ncbi:autotransporter assembly complex family protein [Psychrobacter arenosus]|uniref:autotransporter assembly complex protein TamA n=1 Tax=Psychrobacter arenosus TaxID=256326 RepID=UPI001D12CBF3|nr:BamA/TamA family outer membrane protein [Psychrobacter arenosus]
MRGKTSTIATPVATVSQETDKVCTQTISSSAKALAGVTAYLNTLYAAINTACINRPFVSRPAVTDPTLTTSLSSMPKKYFATTALATAMSSLMLVSYAEAAETTSATDVLNSVTTSKDSKNKNDTKVNQALDALRLKKAVDDGLIDASVLEEYREQTLNNKPPKNPDFDFKKQSAADKEAANQQNSTGTTAPNTAANANANTEAGEGLDNNSAPPPNAPIPLVSQAVLVEEAQQLQQDGYKMMTPSEIDSQLGVVDGLVQQAAQFDTPVATLDSKVAPIGLDTELSSATLTAPSNLETLGLEEETPVTSTSTPVMDRPIEVSNSVSSGKVASGDDITEQANPTKILAQQNDDQIKGSEQQQQTDAYVKAVEAAKGEKIDPDDYLPDYEASSESDAVADSLDDSAAKSPTRARNSTNPLKRLYNRYFKDGYVALPRVNATVYLEQKATENTPAKLIKADAKTQPISNIKASLEDITVQSIEDFTAALPRLRQTALNAAKAVGYYEVTLRLKRTTDDQIDVIIEELGEPVLVDSRLIDVRGEGGDDPKFQALEKSLPPQEKDIFNHGVYKSSKAALETLSSNEGYFDQYWLNKSVDIILPDNTADVDLIYDTGERYKFDEIVFFTYDSENNELTRDPNKLPVKPELLRKLLGFEAGDPYYRPDITKFSNDLSATRYFNTVNVEVILPSEAEDKAATLGFDSTVGDDDPLDPANDADLTISDGSIQVNTDTDSSGATLTSENNGSANSETIDQQDIAPINFQVDAETQAKLLAIQQKAERLISLPDDRVLDEKDQKAKNLLGRISDSISNIAEKIIPDDSDKNTVLKPEKLAGRKTPEEVQQDKKVPLYVYVSSEKPRDAQVGIGYGTDTGVRATGKIDYNLINRDGYQAGLEVAASRINKNVTVYGKRPWNHPLNDTLDAQLTYEEEVIDQGEGNFDLSTKTLKAALARNIRRENSWDRTYSLRYRLDQLDTSVDEAERDNLPVRFTSSQPRQQALLLGYGMSKLDVDNVTNPTMGIRQYYGLEAGAEGALTDTNMAIARAGVRGLYSFGENKEHQVLGKFDAGYLWADDFYEVPYKLRFFAGGDQSIRGFDYNSLSPIEKGYLTGGQILAVGSAEYNYEFKPGLRAAVFTDVGNAYDKDFDTDTKVGVGVGVRWASPIGVVRVDVAAGVTEESIPVRLHFFIGSPL